MHKAESECDNTIYFLHSLLSSSYEVAIDVIGNWLSHSGMIVSDPMQRRSWTFIHQYEATDSIIRLGHPACLRAEKS